MSVIGFITFLVLFVAIGLYSNRGQAKTQASYLLAESSISPLLTALSAAATKYSGYMFIGLMGYIYLYGLSAIWLIVGFLFGDLLAFTTVPASIRRATGKTGALSFAQLISQWNGVNYRIVRAAIGLLTLIFLSTYAAAQLNAGGKALQALFGWSATAGALIGAGLILTYCLTGGLRASIWTDAAQSILMMLAMGLLMFAAIGEAGGWQALVSDLAAVSDDYLDWGPKRFGSVGATLLFAFGWLFNGLGVTGQPQVMVRFMAMDSASSTFRTGIYYFLWSGTFLAISLIVGLAARLYISNETGFDAELALPTLAQALLPGIAIGVVIGGIFAASLSTADSQVLSCSAVLSEDFKLFNNRLRTKQLATFAVIIGALAIAIFSAANVFTLVIVAWSALACSIGPLVIVLALGGKPSQPIALLMMACGLTVALLWRYYGLSQQLYEGAPGMLSGFLIYGLAAIGQKLKGPSPYQDQFDNRE